MILYMVGKLVPNSTHFTRGLVKYAPGRGYFRAVPSQTGDKFATSSTPPIVERLNFVLIGSNAILGWRDRGSQRERLQVEVYLGKA